MTDDIIAFKGEIFLLSWSESHKGGRTGVFLFDDESQDHPLKKFTTRKGKRAGQRFACVLVQIDDDETPVKQKGGSLSKAAARMCENTGYQSFARKWFNKEGIAYDEMLTPYGIAREMICFRCKIKSRAELDHDQLAAKSFHVLMREFNSECWQ